MTLVLELAGPTDTECLGRAVGERLRPGDVVVLSGPLGAGKTVLARGIGAGLGVRGPVTSPTFVIAREHPAAPGGRGVPLVHVDAYRLGGISELDDLDLDTDLLAAAVVVEWGEGMAERLADEHLLIRLQPRADESRVAELCGPARLLPHGVMSHGVMSHGVMSHGVMSHGVLPHGVMSHGVTSRVCPAVPETPDP